MQPKCEKGAKKKKACQPNQKTLSLIVTKLLNDGRFERMLAMPEINHIKKWRNIKSLSINEISKRTGFCWETVKKYADDDQLPQETQVKKHGMMYDEKWGEIVSDWLMEDYALKKKLRRNNRIIFKQLKKIGFQGSYRTVCDFIAEWKTSKLDETDEVKEEIERLHHPPAEAQVDFGLTEVVHEGSFKDVHCLIMSLPYSNGGFVVPMPAENQECFLEGLKILFTQVGFVPRKLRLDNLSAAVVKARSNGKETVFTEAFQRFAAHYGFEPVACNPYRGQEKGHVENKVGYTRYDFFVPSPVIRDWEHLTELLFDHFTKDHQRKHYRKKAYTIAALIEQERKYALALPDVAYPVFKEQLVTANKYGEVRIDKASIHIPKSYHYNQMRLITYWDRYKIASLQGELLSEGFRPYMNKAREIPWHSILKNWLQKPRAITYSRYFPYLPGRIAHYLHIDSMDLRKERVEWLIQILIKYDMSEIAERFYELLPVDTNHYPSRLEAIQHPYDVNWNMYDSLQPKENGGAEHV